MNVDLYADPSCPFTWITYTWLTRAVGDDDALVVRPLSLAVVNADEDVPEPWSAHQAAALPVLRVVELVRRDHGDGPATALFGAAARRFHLDADHTFAGLAHALTEVGLDPALAEKAGDDDADIRASVDTAAWLVGERVGSPVVAFPDTGGAFWGPVLRTVPAEPAAVLAAVATLAATDGFAQVKASLGGDLDLASTATD